jgi:hypothetical protein
VTTLLRRYTAHHVPTQTLDGDSVFFAAADVARGSSPSCQAKCQKHTTLKNTSATRIGLENKLGPPIPYLYQDNRNRRCDSPVSCSMASLQHIPDQGRSVDLSVLHHFLREVCSALTRTRKAHTLQYGKLLNRSVSLRQAWLSARLCMCASTHQGAHNPLLHTMSEVLLHTCLAKHVERTRLCEPTIAQKRGTNCKCMQCKLLSQLHYPKGWLRLERFLTHTHTWQFKCTY